MKTSYLLSICFVLSIASSEASLAQDEISEIPFESIPGNTALIGESIELQTNTTITGSINATGQVITSTGFQFPDGTVQITAAGAGAGLTANNGFYRNIIAEIIPTNAYTEVCIKGGVVMFDIHSGSESTAGGFCVPGDTGWLIERFLRPATNWGDARMKCLMDGLRLPEPFEWQYSCDNDDLFALDSMPESREWASNNSQEKFSNTTSIVTSVALGDSTCRHGGHGTVAEATGNVSSYVYRCVR